MTVELVMTKGLPGSGKSHWAREQQALNPSIVLVDKDGLRRLLHGGKWSKVNEAMVLAVRDAIVAEALSARRSVIVHDTGFHPSHEARLRELAKAHDARFRVQDFTDVPLEVCIERDLRRPESVGEKVIRRMWRDYLAPASVAPPAYDQALPDAVIVDIDGTLAHMTNRGPYDTTKYDDDEFDPLVAEVISRFASGHNVAIIVCSGRDEEFREVTEKWMIRHGLKFWCHFFMRPRGDKRRDAVVKQEMYDNHIKGKYNVRLVLDDRDRVVDMWRSNGLRCFQVAEGDF